MIENVVNTVWELSKAGVPKDTDTQVKNACVHLVSRYLNVDHKSAHFFCIVYGCGKDKGWLTATEIAKHLGITLIDLECYVDQLVDLRDLYFIQCRPLDQNLGTSLSICKYRVRPELASAIRRQVPRPKIISTPITSVRNCLDKLSHLVKLRIEGELDRASFEYQMEEFLLDVHPLHFIWTILSDELTATEIGILAIATNERLTEQLPTAAENLSIGLFDNQDEQDLFFHELKYGKSRLVELGYLEPEICDRGTALKLTKGFLLRLRSNKVEVPNFHP